MSANQTPRNTQSSTLYERVLKRLKNNPVVVAMLVLFSVIAAIGPLVDTYNKLWPPKEKVVDSPSIA